MATEGADDRLASAAMEGGKKRGGGGRSRVNTLHVYFVDEFLNKNLPSPPPLLQLPSYSMWRLPFYSITHAVTLQRPWRNVQYMEMQYTGALSMRLHILIFQE